MNIIYASKLRKVNDVQVVLPQTCSSTDSSIKVNIKKFVVDYLYNERTIKKHQF